MTETNLILFDYNREDLKPLSFTRPVSDIRLGIITIKEKWEQMMETKGSYHCTDYLATKYPIKFSEKNILINSTILPTPELSNYIKNSLPANTLLAKNGVPIALKTNTEIGSKFLSGNISAPETIECELDFTQISYPWDIFSFNGIALKTDFDLLTKNRTSKVLSSTNTIIGDISQIFVEEGAWVECATLNTTKGPIYIGKNATIMEGCHIRGGFALCEGATVKMGAKIYGPTTVGPFSKVGGELNNCVILGYSNKGHDGFLGNSVIGEWCNLGADTNNSNLKNNYSEVRQWNYKHKSFIPTGLQFCGLIMGDHSKAGINTMFNTGTVVGVSSNIYGGDFPRTFVPSFAWGSSKGFKNYNLEKSIGTAKTVYQRRNKKFDATDERILKHIFEETSIFRKY
ncbi:MAG: GlmU family protein [Saprospiraceae bacterium]|nr:GlmU family protein [Saprospiraceae bacterium]